ncbi:hypothetical protein RB594_008458 [Gaeumannomyces avenae]
MMECGIARSAVMGSMNVHMEISFEDGVKWIARLRKLNATSPPPALRDYILGSEVATLKFLEQTTVPAPKVFDFALKHTDNPVGVGYVLVEKLSGRSLRWSLATPEQRKKVMDQLADMFIKLQKHPFDRLCSLASMEDPRNPGPFARTSLTDFVRLLGAGLPEISVTGAGSTTAHNDTNEKKEKDEEQQQQQNGSNSEEESEVALIDLEELAQIAAAFGSKIPDCRFSPAEIQGFLLKRKKDPHRALREVDGWVSHMVEQKTSKSKILRVQ